MRRDAGWIGVQIEQTPRPHGQLLSLSGTGRRDAQQKGVPVSGRPDRNHTDAIATGHRPPVDGDPGLGVASTACSGTARFCAARFAAARFATARDLFQPWNRPRRQEGLQIEGLGRLSRMAQAGQCFAGCVPPREPRPPAAALPRRDRIAILSGIAGITALAWIYLLVMAREALLHTQEYVGAEMLPDLEGWSHWDARVAIDAFLDEPEPEAA